MRLNLEVLEARDVPDGAPTDAQPDPGLQLLTELREQQRLATLAAVGGVVYVGSTFVQPTPQVLFLPSDLILPDLVPTKP